MDGTEYLERVRALLPELADRAAACEALRQLPDETYKAFQEQGLMRAVQPRRFGGHELDLRTFHEAIALVASACPSSAWFLGVVGVHAWQLALFAEQAQVDVWGDDSSVLISSSYAPTGRIEPVDEGYRVSGRWSFSSGCDRCDWVFLGGPVEKPDPVPDMRTYLIPRSDYEIVDTWHVAGLAGTGSKDIVVEGAFVPEHRTHRFLDAYNLASPGQAENTGALYRLPFGCVFSSCISVPAIGAARGALHAYRDQMRKKLAVFDGSKVADDPFAQLRLSEATAEIDSAWSEICAVWEPLCALAEAGEPLPLDLRVRTRWNGASAVKRSVRAVDILFEASGGRGLYLDNPIQRFFRDVHAMRAHAANNPDRAAILFGRTELHPGEPPRDFFL